MVLPRLSPLMSVASLLLATGCASSSGNSGSAGGGDLASGDEAGEAPIGAVMTVLERPERSNDEPLPARSIVDLNSTLEVKFDKVALRHAIVESGLASQTIAGALAQFRVLEEAATAGVKALEGLARSTAMRDDGDQASLAQFHQRLSEVAEAALLALGPFLDDPSMPEAMELEEAFAARANESGSVGSVYDQYELIFAMAAKAADRLRGEVATALRDDGLYVQFGAWLRTSADEQPLHVPGFDDYPQEEYVRVPRFVVAITSDQLEELDATKARIDAAGGASRELIVKLLKEQFRPAITAALANLEQEFTSELGAVDAVTGAATAAASRFEVRLASVKSLLVRATALAKELQAKAKLAPTGDPMALVRYALIEWKAASDAVGTLVKDVRTEVAGLAAEIDALQQEEVPAGLDAVRALVAQLKAGFGDDSSGGSQSVVARLLAVIDSSLQVLPGFRHASQVADAQLAFGAEVKRFDIESFPSFATLDLHYASRRSRGDDIVLKLGAAKRADPDDDRVEPTAVRTLAHWSAGLYQTDPYVRLSAGIVFANPSGKDGLQSDFDTGVAYHFLLKGDSDEHALWNDLLDPGIGLTLAALDLDGDDSREIGVAATVSLFRDFVQVGWGYDLQETQGFFMIGFVLPLTGTTFSLGGADAP